MQLRYFVFNVLYFWVKVLSYLGKSTFLKLESYAIRGFDGGLKVFKKILKE